MSLYRIGRSLSAHAGPVFLLGGDALAKDATATNWYVWHRPIGFAGAGLLAGCLPFRGQPAGSVGIPRHGSSQTGFSQAFSAELIQHRPIRVGAADHLNPCRAFVAAATVLVVGDSSEHLSFDQGNFRLSLPV